MHTGRNQPGSPPFSSQVDLCAVSGGELAKIDARFGQAVNEALSAENRTRPDGDRLTVECEWIGERPGGQPAVDAAIVQTIPDSDEALGIPTRLTASSTDSGMPQGLGVPAVTPGSRGSWRRMHSVTECCDSTDSHKGIQHIVAAELATSGIEWRGLSVYVRREICLLPGACRHLSNPGIFRVPNPCPRILAVGYVVRLRGKASQ